MVKIITSMFCGELFHKDFAKRPYHQLIYCIKCEGRLTDANKGYPIHDGYIIYLPPNAEDVKVRARKGEMSYIYLEFETDEFFVDYNRVLVLPDNVSEDMYKEIRQIVVWGQLDSHSSYHKLRDQMCRLVFTKLEMMSEMTLTEREVNDYKADIIENISRADFKINDFMESADLTRSNVSKKFRCANNETAKQFYDRKKIEFIKSFILSNPERNFKLTELATLCGYDEHFYFLRLFKKHVGMSPTEFKEKYGKR